MAKDNGPAKRAPEQGRDWGKSDYRVPRPYETQVNPAKYREGWDRIFGKKQRGARDAVQK